MTTKTTKRNPRLTRPVVRGLREVINFAENALAGEHELTGEEAQEVRAAIEYCKDIRKSKGFY